LCGRVLYFGQRTLGESYVTGKIFENVVYGMLKGRLVRLMQNELHVTQPIGEWQRKKNARARQRFEPTILLHF
jgi:hypothetical protein